eukprot:NODE_17927_length_919_cov_4.963384.p1 GENE.NODE_17927_length_919_cov_4.963384~~NODE_17927_length_919_cov_4.963384.p1  ORF type:complete len:177 (-),score=37.40 NODE_17927_length_919_cov_4.963384:285-815(-)
MYPVLDVPEDTFMRTLAAATTLNLAEELVGNKGKEHWVNRPNLYTRNMQSRMQFPKDLADEWHIIGHEEAPAEVQEDADVVVERKALAQNLGVSVAEVKLVAVSTKSEKPRRPAVYPLTGKRGGGDTKNVRQHIIETSPKKDYPFGNPGVQLEHSAQCPCIKKGYSVPRNEANPVI